MRRRIALGAVVVALVFAGCSGDSNPAPSDAVESPGRSSTSPSAPGSSLFPPKFIACMADRGISINSPADFHAPGAEQAFQECLAFLHGGS
jgi:hypothetical protein